MKVHFAGNREDCGTYLLQAGVKYRLESFYDIKVRNKIDGIENTNQFEHVIIDSGLFTFMFGSDSKDELTMEFCREWQDSYIEFINATPFNNADFVEMDVQKKLGSDEAWELRRDMKSRINKGSVINVYHLEDGNPDKLIDFSDYIAVSLPELRLNVGNKEREQIIAYISRRAQAKGKRVHILGCTERKYMKRFSSCDSCDSTSWQAAFRFGRGRSESFGEYAIEKLREQADGKPHEVDVRWCAFMALQDYRRWAGNQA